MVAGSSMGGLISFHIGLSYPDTFGMIGAFSPSFQINTKEARQAFINDIDPLDNLPRMYIDAGDKESLYQYVGPVSDELFNANYPKELIYTMIGKDHQHNEAAWRARFPLALNWLTGSEDGNYVEPTTKLALTVNVDDTLLTYLHTLDDDGKLYILDNSTKEKYELIYNEENDCYNVEITLKPNSVFKYQVIYFKEDVLTVYAHKNNSPLITEITINDEDLTSELTIDEFQQVEKVIVNLTIPEKTSEYFATIKGDKSELIAYTGNLSNSHYFKLIDDSYSFSYFATPNSSISFKVLYYLKDVHSIFENKTDGTDTDGRTYNINNGGTTIINHIVEGWQIANVELTVNVTSPEIVVPENETLMMGLYGSPFGGSWRNSQMTTVTPTTFTFLTTTTSGKIELSAGYVLFKEGTQSPYVQVFEKKEAGGSSTKVSNYEIVIPFSTWTADKITHTINHTVEFF